MQGYIYLDATPIDDGLPYYFGWDQFKAGKADGRKPTTSNTAGGTFTAYPLPTAYNPREGHLAIYAQVQDELHKRRVESVIKALMNGQRRLHFAGRWLDVYFTGAEETSDDFRKTATVVGVEADWVAPQPLWTYNQPFKGCPPNAVVNAGSEYQLWNDGSLPTPVPAYAFTTASFTLNNWGTGFTSAAGTITGGPVSTTIYLRNTTPGAPSARLAITTNGAGAATFLATSEFYLAPGLNTLELDTTATGTTPITPGGSFIISFGDTYPRFL